MEAKDTGSKKTSWQKLVLILVLVLIVGGFLAFFGNNWRARGTSDVTASVRIADGATEDEVAVVSTAIVKVVRADNVILNAADYFVGEVELPDGTSLAFTDCKLQGVYAPVKCATEEGTSYWITLTEIK